MLQEKNAHLYETPWSFGINLKVMHECNMNRIHRWGQGVEAPRWRFVDVKD